MNGTNSTNRFFLMTALLLVAIASALAADDETIVSGGGVVVVSDSKVKKIPINQAPKQLRDALNNASFSSSSHK